MGIDNPGTDSVGGGIFDPGANSTGDGIDTSGTGSGQQAYYVSPGMTGASDANTGLSHAQSFATLAPIYTLISNNTLIPAVNNWVDQNGAPTPISGLVGVAARVSWENAAIAGNRFCRGGQIIIDDSVAPARLTQTLVMHGLVLRSYVPGQRARLWGSAVLPNSGWVTTAQANVFKLAHGSTTYFRCAVWENNVMLSMVGAANIAAALPILQANPGSSYPDPATGDLYIYPTGGVSPNTNGKSYEYSVNTAGATDVLAIDAGGGLIKDILFQRSIAYDPTNGTIGALGVPITQAIGDAQGTDITWIANCRATEYSKHGIELASTSDTGLYLVTGSSTDAGAPGFPKGTFTGFVTYSSGANNGTAVTRHDACDFIGGMDSHNSGGSQQFAEQRFTNCTNLAGGYGASETAAVVSSGNNGTSLVSFQATTTSSTNDVFGYGPPDLAGTVTMTNPVIQPGVVNPQGFSFIRDTSSLTNPSIFMLNGNYLYSWARAATYSMTISGGVISTIPSAGLFDAFTPGTDTIAISGTSLVAADSWPLITNYNSTAVVRTYAQAISDGLLTSTSYADLFQFNANTSLLYKDAGMTQPATANGDNVAVAFDQRDNGTFKYVYLALTNVTLFITGGKKRLRFNGTNSNAGMIYAVGAGAIDLKMYQKNGSVSMGLIPQGSIGGYATAFITSGSGARLTLKNSGTQWGTWSGSDSNSGTALSIGTQYVLGMAIAASAGGSGNFYTNGAADGTFTATSGVGGANGWCPQFGNNGGIQYAQMDVAGILIAGIQKNSTQMAADNTALQAMF